MATEAKPRPLPSPKRTEERAGAGGKREKWIPFPEPLPVNATHRSSRHGDEEGGRPGGGGGGRRGGTQGTGPSSASGADGANWRGGNVSVMMTQGGRF